MLFSDKCLICKKKVESSPFVFLFDYNYLFNCSSFDHCDFIRYICFDCIKKNLPAEEYNDLIKEIRKK